MQVDDICYYTNNAEDEMVASMPSGFTDAAVYDKRIAEASDTVKKTIRRRMTRKTSFALGGICLAMFLLCFMPFILANRETAQSATTAIAMSIALVGTLAVILIVSLFVMRLSVVNAVKAYNDTVREIMNDIQSSMRQASKYLSALCNVRRGHTVQNYTHKNIDEYTRSLRIRKKHQEEIRKKRAQLSEHYGDYLGDRSCYDKTMSQPYDYDFDQTTEYSYPAPFLAGDFRQIEFISNGNLVTVPLSYVTRILVRMEGIYEK